MCDRGGAYLRLSASLLGALRDYLQRPEVFADLKIMNKLPDWISAVLVNEHGFTTRSDNTPQHDSSEATASRYRAERGLGPLSLVANIHDRAEGGYRISISFLNDVGSSDPRVLSADFDTQAGLDQNLHLFINGAQDIIDGKYRD